MDNRYYSDTWANWADLNIDPNHIIFTANLCIGRWEEVIVTTPDSSRFTVWAQGRLQPKNWTEFTYSRAMLVNCACSWYEKPSNEITRVVGLFLCNYLTEAEWTLAALQAL